MDSTIVNKVASSGLVTIDLEQFLPTNHLMEIDLAPQLFQGLVLREKDFREWIKHHLWSNYQDAYVHIHCSADAVIPQWAFMLVSIQLAGVAQSVVQATKHEAALLIAHHMVERMDLETYRDTRVIVKGCSDALINGHAYTYLTYRLQPLVKSLMFGEPCSTVPLYKRAQ
jgi:Protein of unknown function (DUF2480)